MANGRFVSYLRVSTAKQGNSGLGLEAQRAAVAGYLNGGKWKLIEEVVEVESGRRNDRPSLQHALRLCRLHRATLVVGKLDRLARNVYFISSLMEAQVDFVAVDFPTANRLTIHILAAVAEHEAAATSTRTRDALAAAKARGVALGGLRGDVSRMAAIGALGNVRSTLARTATAEKRRQDLQPIIEGLRASGAGSLRQIACELNAKGIQAARGGKWTPTQVARVLAA